MCPESGNHDPLTPLLPTVVTPRRDVDLLRQSERARGLGQTADRIHKVFNPPAQHGAIHRGLRWSSRRSPCASPLP